MKVMIVFLTLCSLAVCQTSTSTSTETSSNLPHAQYKDASGTQWNQYNPQASISPSASQHQAHHDHQHYMSASKQGLVGAPFYGVFPIIFLIGLAAIIIIPLLFFTFSPYGFAAGMSSGYGRKRSMVDSFDVNSFKKGMLDMVTTVSDAIEKYGAMASVFETLKKKS